MNSLLKMMLLLLLLINNLPAQITKSELKEFFGRYERVFNEFKKNTIALSKGSKTVDFSKLIKVRNKYVSDIRRVTPDPDEAGSPLMDTFTDYCYEPDATLQTETGRVIKSHLEKYFLFLNCDMMYWFLDLDNYAYLNFTSKMLTHEQYALLSLYAEHYTRNITNDAAIAVSWTELGNRVMKWNKLFYESTGKLIKQEAKIYLFDNLGLLCFGTDNTTPDDHGSELNPEWENVINDIIKKCSYTEWGKTLKEYYTHVKKNGFDQSDPFFQEMRGKLSIPESSVLNDY
jgi:hypothetical protein